MAHVWLYERFFNEHERRNEMANDETISCDRQPARLTNNAHQIARDLVATHRVATRRAIRPDDQRLAMDARPSVELGQRSTFAGAEAVDETNNARN